MFLEYVVESHFAFYPLLALIEVKTDVLDVDLRKVSQETTRKAISRAWIAEPKDQVSLVELLWHSFFCILASTELSLSLFVLALGLCETGPRSAWCVTHSKVCTRTRACIHFFEFLLLAPLS